MSKRCIVLFHSTTLNGPPQSFAWITIHSPSPSTLPYVLVQVHQLECMVWFKMWLQTSYVPKVLGQYLAGWLTTCSCAYSITFSQNITKSAELGIATSCQEADSKKGEGFGLEAKDSKMVCLRSSMRTVPFPSRTYQSSQHDQLTMLYTHTTSTTLTGYLANSASHGRSQRTGHLPAPQHTLVSTGTLRPTRSHWQQPREKNILK